MLTIKRTEQGVVFPIQVLPRSSKCELAGIHGDALKIKITAPPVEGRANDECIRFLSSLLNVKKQQISIKAGHQSRNKWICIAGVTPEDVQSALMKTHAIGVSGLLFESPS